MAGETDQVIGSSETEAKLVVESVSSEAVKLFSWSAVAESPVKSVEGPLEAIDSSISLPDAVAVAVIFAFVLEPVSNSLEEPGLWPALDSVSGEAEDSGSLSRGASGSS